MVSQIESEIATGSVMTLTGVPKWRPPSTEQLAHTVPGAQSWYETHTIELADVSPAGTNVSVHCRSTKNGCPDELLSSSADLPWIGQVLPWSSDLKMSICRVSWTCEPPLRLLRYTAPVRSVLTEVSPDQSCAMPPLAHVLPLSVDR